MRNVVLNPQHSHVAFCINEVWSLGRMPPDEVIALINNKAAYGEDSRGVREHKVAAGNPEGVSKIDYAIGHNVAVSSGKKQTLIRSPDLLLLSSCETLGPNEVVCRARVGDKIFDFLLKLEY